MTCFNINVIRINVILCNFARIQHYGGIANVTDLGFISYKIRTRHFAGAFRHGKIMFLDELISRKPMTLRVYGYRVIFTS